MILRDRVNASLWQNVPYYVPNEKNNLYFNYDVAIIGAGITGITSAWKLQHEGKNV